MRTLAAAVLFMVAGALLLVAGLTLSNAWDPKPQDSPDSTYIVTAAVYAALALPALAVGLWALRSR